MKIKRLILGLGLGASILAGCNDEMSSIGTSIQPGDDTISVYTDTFRIQASTVLLDSIYARTTSAQLGELYDPLYGNLKSDYLCQFYCPDNYRFKYTPIDGKIDSVDFRIYYNSSSSTGNRNGIWIGDSLAPMQAEIFKITQPLQKHFYTNIDPEQYCDMRESLGLQAYTSYNASIPDSIRKKDTYTPNIRIKIPLQFGQKFYDETINNPASFNSQATFDKFFPGLYVTTTFGSGNILSVNNSVFSIYYKYKTKSTRTGNDTIINASERFSVTQEVIQLSRFKNTDMSGLLLPSNEYTYLKTPAGVCTRVVIPSRQIAPIMKDRIINNLPLSLKAMPQESWKYALAPPSYLLVIPEDSVKNFFEQGQIENNQTSFLSQAYDASTRTYTFGNIANILKDQIQKNPDKDMNLLIIPVIRSTTVGGNSYESTEMTSAISNFLAPSGVKIRKDEEVMKIAITSSKYAK